MSKKYPNGYWPKIEYWTSKLKDEVSNTKVPDLKMIDKIHSKLDFFIQKQWDLTISVK